MPEYTFQSLSTYDFELLARDLLQAELGILLESFAKGPDGGMDFRFQSPNGNLVVQCKHYPSNYNDLYRILERDEAPKVHRLRPSRYVLTVSTPLTPNRKDRILSLLTPFCRTSADILGGEDLNNLLGRHSNVETKHFKLWLTSEPVLSRVLHGAIWGDAELTMDKIRLRASRYVPNPSLSRAKQILDKHHYCIIAGIPGIGKTTLAEILLIEFVERHGFQAIRIANDLSEIKPVKNPRIRQIFYFDDFLGKTTLDKLQKNEDQRLMEFIEEVGGNGNWRFIMTTREYILNVAKNRYEALAQPSVDLTPCVINLADYTYPIRAKILYNHLFFSDLPDPYKRALLEDSNYRMILQHDNHNPRIIDHMTQARHVAHLPVAQYFPNFIENLNNPTRIWDHAFRNQLSEPAQHLLLVKASMPDEVLVRDLEVAFGRFFQYRRTKLGFSCSSRDFERALKELDGNFINTSLIGKNQIATFHNPSVSDFLENYLFDSPNDVVDLFESTSFFDQYIRLWQGKAGTRFRGIEQNKDRFVRTFAKHVDDPTCKIIRIGDGQGGVIGAKPWQFPLEARISFAIEVADGLGTPDSRGVVDQLLRALRNRLKEGQGDRESLVRLLRKIRTQFTGSVETESLFAAARDFLTTGLEDITDFSCVAMYMADDPKTLSPSDLDRIRGEFRGFCDTCDRWDSDPD